MSALEAGVLDAAAERVRAGGLVAYPTETLYGVGADARSDAAMACLRAWKGRGAAQPVSILVAELADLEAIGIELPAAARRLATAFWPGPLTLVLPAHARFAAGVARDDGAVGVRCSPHPVALALARRLAREGLGPITSTSLNRSGAPPAKSRAEARVRCTGPGAPLLVDDDAAPEPAGAPSTVVDATRSTPAVLRLGAIGESMLAPVLAGGTREELRSA